jgi:hypothetical protein
MDVDHVNGGKRKEKGGDRTNQRLGWPWGSSMELPEKCSREPNQKKQRVGRFNTKKGKRKGKDPRVSAKKWPSGSRENAFKLCRYETWGLVLKRRRVHYEVLRAQEASTAGAVASTKARDHLLIELRGLPWLGVTVPGAWPRAREGTAHRASSA